MSQGSETLRKPQFTVKTLGCKANWVDGQALEAQYLDFKKRSHLPQIFVLNSCSVTDEADHQSLKAAQKLRRQHPEAIVVMTGCSTEVRPEDFIAKNGAHLVVGNQDKHRLLDLVSDWWQEQSTSQAQAGLSDQPHALADRGLVLGKVLGYSEMASRHPMDREWPLPQATLPDLRQNKNSSEEGNGASSTSRTRAFLKIQDGCNEFCTYCIIPYGRGPSRSLGVKEVVGQVKEAESRGHKEVILTGINLGDYTGGIEALLVQVLRETSIERIRLGSLDPVEISCQLTDLIQAEQRLCPHLHVSLQSPVSAVLKGMKRKYSYTEVEACLTRLSGLMAKDKEPLFVGMDVITGFPGETEADFIKTVERLKALPWDRLHVFPYSERSGTPATRMKGVVPKPIRMERASVLRQLSLERQKARAIEYIALLKSIDPVSVLVEGKVRGPDGRKDWSVGHTPAYRRILFRSPERDLSQNQFIELNLEQAKLEPFIEPQAGDVSFVYLKNI